MVTFSTLTVAKRPSECFAATFAHKRLEIALEMETCCPWIICCSALDGFFIGCAAGLGAAAAGGRGCGRGSGGRGGG